jgi:molecular chaperone DnaK (HSP70)
MAKMIGIDLGTTNSVAAHETRTGAEVILNDFNEKCTPSVVGLYRDGFQVGDIVFEAAKKHPEEAIFSVKRLMGRFYDDPNVREVDKRCEYELVKPEDGDDVRIKIRDKILTPVDVSAMILEKVKSDAERRLGEEVTHAVITVPAYFSMNQRAATRAAGEHAKLRVKTIIDEPTAAAMAFGVDIDPAVTKTVLVYDLGGGTFDISILFISGQVFTQMAIEGDMWLGGDDFDFAIMDHVIKEVKKEYKVDPSSNKVFKVILKQNAEKAKKQLSQVKSTSITMMNSVPMPNGDSEDVDLELTREQFEDLPISSNQIKFGGVSQDVLKGWLEDLKLNGNYADGSVTFGPDTVRNRIKKSILLTRKALKEAGISKDEIDHVLLVGGSTTIPLVQRMLEEEFGPDKIMRNIDPMSCVAVGAAIAAERIPGIICHNVVGKDPSGKDRLCLESNPEDAIECHKCKAALIAQKICPECNHPNPFDAEKCEGPDCGHSFKMMIPLNVTAKPVGIMAEGNQYEILIQKSMPYPTEKPVVRRFKTASNTELAVRVPIYSSEVTEFNPKDDDQFVCAADIDLLGTHLPSGTPVDVSVEIDKDGCLEIRAIIVDNSGRHAKVFINPKVGRDRALHQQTPGQGNGGQQPQQQEETPEWENMLWGSILYAEIAFKNYRRYFSDANLPDRLARLTEEAKRVCDRKDEKRGKELDKEIYDSLANDFRGYMNILHAEFECLKRHLEPAQVSRLRTCIKDVCDAIDAQMSKSEAEHRMNVLVDAIHAARKTRPEAKAEDKGAFLRRAN